MTVFPAQNTTSFGKLFILSFWPNTRRLTTLSKQRNSIEITRDFDFMIYFFIFLSKIVNKWSNNWITFPVTTKTNKIASNDFYLMLIIAFSSTEHKRCWPRAYVQDGHFLVVHVCGSNRLLLRGRSYGGYGKLWSRFRSPLNVGN